VVLVDSSVWIDFFNGRESRETDLLTRLLRRRILLTGDLILAEVLQGFRQNRDMEAARHVLLSLPYADMSARRWRSPVCRTIGHCGDGASQRARRSM
jgi:predicted nucleic acid-binding protein